LTQRRGPDHTEIVKLGKYTLVHNLLSITGTKTQPFYDGDLVCVYNGEIYNHAEFGEFETDGECILPAFKMFGEHLHTVLDGEFSILIYDRTQGRVWSFTDPFGTKPLFELRGNYGTYPSSIGGTGRRIRTLYNWDLEQKKDTYDDWIRAFRRAVAKRTRDTREGIFFGLSSGYDSGAIACECLVQRVDFETHTVLGKEQNDVLAARLAKGIKNTRTYWNDDLSEHYFNYLMYNAERFEGILPFFDGKIRYSTLDDPASHKLCWVCEQAKGRKIYLSGQGADEITSDYGHNGYKHFGHSNFGGKFPSDLKEIFPWPSFYGTTMEAYLAKEEYVAGSYGIETRYPFLDKELVQEFLWLTPELKNRFYKAPIHEYLKRNDFPFNEGKKTGF
jgi:asparagine synthetase B (glutamine-hydrolysing)